MCRVVCVICEYIGVKISWYLYVLAQSNHLRSLVRSAVKLILDSWCYTNSTLEIKVNGRKAGEHAWYIILYMPILLSLKLQKRSCKNKFDFLAIISIFHAVQIDIVAEIIMYLYKIQRSLKFTGSLYFAILKQISSKDFDVNCQCFWNNLFQHEIILCSSSLTCPWLRKRQ